MAFLQLQARPVFIHDFFKNLLAKIIRDSVKTALLQMGDANTYNPEISLIYSTSKTFIFIFIEMTD